MPTQGAEPAPFSEPAWYHCRRFSRARLQWGRGIDAAELPGARPEGYGDLVLQWGRGIDAAELKGTEKEKEKGVVDRRLVGLLDPERSFINYGAKRQIVGTGGKPGGTTKLIWFSPAFLRERVRRRSRWRHGRPREPAADSRDNRAATTA